MKKLIILALATVFLGLAGVQRASAGVAVGAKVVIPLAPGYYGSSYYSPYYAYPRPAYGYGYNYYPPPVVYSPPILTYQPRVAVFPPVLGFGFNSGGYNHGYNNGHY